jgi:hypothetical protein
MRNTENRMQETGGKKEKKRSIGLGDVGWSTGLPILLIVT